MDENTPAARTVTRYGAALTPVERQIGRNIRQLRETAGVTQKELAEMLGLQKQQVLKYENATTKISAARLFAASRALECPLLEFFEDCGDVASVDGAPAPRVEDPRLERAMGEMYRLAPSHQRAVADLALALLDEAPPGPAAPKTLILDPQTGQTVDPDHHRRGAANAEREGA